MNKKIEKPKLIKITLDERTFKDVMFGLFENDKTKNIGVILYINAKGL